MSYAGQSRLTFPDATRQRHNFIRFVATSLCGFTLNFLSYAALLRWTSLDYRVSLVIVLTGVSAVTYLLLSRWVFSKRGIAV